MDRSPSLVVVSYPLWDRQSQLRMGRGTRRVRVGGSEASHAPHEPDVLERPVRRARLLDGNSVGTRLDSYRPLDARLRSRVGTNQLTASIWRFTTARFRLACTDFWDRGSIRDGPSEMDASTSTRMTTARTFPRRRWRRKDRSRVRAQTTRSLDRTPLISDSRSTNLHAET